ncbi:sigma factor [Phocaeicola sp.]|uniref:sigma factor n=1 Tax=Phocaeicola sp. TaxID=2773926 RepID=UPI003AB1F0E9
MNILCRIWTNREKLDPESSFKAYLFTIAYHFLIKELRRQLNNASMEEFVEYQYIKVSGDDADKEIDFD